MKTITLNCYGIVVELEEGSGCVSSDLHEDAPDLTVENETPEEQEERELYNSAMDGIEALILGHACAGIDVTTPAYLEGIESAVQGCANNI